MHNKKTIQNFLLGDLKEREYLRTPLRRRKDNIKMDLRSEFDNGIEFKWIRRSCEHGNRPLGPIIHE